MIYSMTGYGMSRTENERFSISINLKSTNHRFLDVQMRLPAALDSVEPNIRRILKNHIQRGHIEMTVNLERLNEADLRLNRELLEAYLKTCEALNKEFGFSSQPDLVALLRVPGVLMGGSDLSEDDLGNAQQVLEKALLDAIERLNEMRQREGETLARDFENRLAHLQELGVKLNDLSTRMAPAFRERLERRIKELTQGQELDPLRLTQEVTALALRSDITEEVTRFQSHVGQARRLLKTGEDVGKKLDFLLQEMNREANTMLAKTTGVPEAGVEIANCAIEMKVEIEKLREQAQNIE
ncbi:MAG TPA: YicC/YloC family endoribonuclease [Terriglobia bacterium]|nr:YicC/YloC family endoribonuclease [Terriglobia bacterium]